MLSKEQDIEALARQSKEIDRRKDPHAETDILPSNAAIATTPNESSSNQLPVDNAKISAEPSATSQNQKSPSVNYDLYFAVICVQFLIVTIVVLVGIIWTSITIDWSCNTYKVL